MNKNFFIHGTQERNIKNIMNNGLENSNSSLFNLKSIGDLNFTIIMTIYHSVGIINQDKILNENYENLTNFYHDNLDLIPNIIIFKNNIDNIIKGEKYQNNYDENVLSHPYVKISNIGKIANDKIHKIIKIDLEDLYISEKNIGEIKEGNDRFFKKYGRENSSIINNNLKTYKLIDKMYMYRLCGNLSKIIISDFL